MAKEPQAKRDREEKSRRRTTSTDQPTPTKSPETDVFVKVGDSRVQAGVVKRQEDLGWRGDCQLCDDFTIESSKKATVDHVETHFLRDHTTSTA